MKPVDMTVLHDPDNNQFGDCQRACIASLLELMTKDVPHFLELGDSDTFYTRLNEFLAEHNFIHLETMPIDFSLAQFNSKADTYHMIYGPTIRGTQHATIGLNGRVVHDPHPSRDGLLANRKDEWTYAFLVPTFVGTNQLT